MAILDDRFRAAREHPPLAGVSAAAERELAHALSQASGLEDLPGKWQAALLAAEAAAAGAQPPPARSCCGSHRAATPAEA
jgi:hypothetical protein